MTRKPLLMAVVSAMALGTAGGVTLLTPPAPAERAEVPEFLDPAAMAAASCGRNPQRNIFNRTALRVALASAAAREQTDAVADRPKLQDGLGDAHFPISTRSAEAQAWFDQGYRLLYAFNHWEAIRAFREAQRLDPACAMCYWGEAVALGPNINLPMDPATIEDTVAAVRKAQDRAATASPMEQALIAAAAARYSPDPEADRAALNEAYAEAMAKIHHDYPDHHDVAALYAESEMDVSPWDYWESDLTTPRPHIARAIAAVEGVLEADPDHVGAIHLYIHLVEASRTPERAERYADKLAELAPAAGHLVHMPGHIYYRVGRYIDSLDLNKRAIAVDQAYLASTKGSDIYRYGYYPHNVHFVLVSAAMAGDGATALEAAEQLDAVVPGAVLEAVPLAQPVKVASYYARVQYAAPDDVLKLEEPPASVPLVRGLWHYARGAAFIEKGDLDAAAREAEAIRRYEQDPAVAALKDHNIPGPGMLKIADLLVRARIDRAQGRTDDAIAKLRQAATEQTRLSYSEPPFWYYPVDQTLGVTLLEAGRHDEAIDAFQRSLRLHPNNSWSLYGLMKAQQAAGDPAAAATEQLYRQATVKPDTEIDLKRL